MLDLSKIENIYLAPGATDLRKSIDGCSNIVQYQCFLILSALLYIYLLQPNKDNNQSFRMGWKWILASYKETDW